MRTRNLAAPVLALALGLVLGGCAPSNAPTDEGAGAGGGSGGHGASGGGEGDGGGYGGGLGDASFDVPVNDSPEEACLAIAEKAELRPVDLFVLFDRSQTMAQPTLNPKWASAEAGLTAFLTDTASSGLGVALKFFPIPGVTTCNPLPPNPYEQLDVPLGELPMHAGDVTAAFSTVTPSGSTTPMYPALAGVLNVALNSSKANPTHTSAVLFVTDGTPNGPAACTGVSDPTDPATIAALVQNGVMASPPILTFVVGLPGAAFATLDTIAAGGGTTQSIRLTDPATVQADFQQALASVRGSTLPCDFAVPDKVELGTIDPDLVNVVYTPGGQTSGAIVPEATDCANGGWQYDDPAAPTKITLCPNTCALVRADTKGPKIDIELGCKSVLH